MLEKVYNNKPQNILILKISTHLKKEDLLFEKKRQTFLNYKGMLKINSILSYILIGG